MEAEVRPGRRSAPRWLESLELWRVVPDGLRETVNGGRCPKCGSRRLHRSRVRGTGELFLRAFSPWRPFSCNECHWRAWRYPESSDGPVLDLPAAPPVRRRKRARTATGRPMLSPVEIIRLRNRQRAVLVVFIALAASGTMVCMQADPTSNADVVQP